MFDQKTARMILRAAECSRMVYDPFKSNGFDLWSSQFTDVFLTVVRNAEAVCLVDGDTAYITFRGTEPSSIKDLMTDARARPEYFPTLGNFAKAHSGIVAYTMSIMPDIIGYAERHKDKKLIITGHSLGGSAATLCSAHLNERGYNPILITFGAAPCLNDTAVDEFNLRVHTIFRFEHGSDFVPVFPQALPWLRHVGQRLYLPNSCKKIWYGASGLKYHADRALGYALAGVKASSWQRALLFAGKEMLNDHSMPLYENHLKECL